MARAKSISGRGQGWFGESIRHANARRLGKAGGKYVTFRSKTREDADKLYTRLHKHGIKAVIYDYPNKDVLVPTKDLTYSQLKTAGIKIKPNADSDKDGVKNKKDCRPLNKYAQDNGLPKTTIVNMKNEEDFELFPQTKKTRIEKFKDWNEKRTRENEVATAVKRRTQADKIEKELETEEHLSESDRERIEDLELHELSDKELKILAIREGEGFFGGNEYKNELERRIKEEATLETDKKIIINDERKRAEERLKKASKDGGSSDGLFPSFDEIFG